MTRARENTSGGQRPSAARGAIFLVVGLVVCPGPLPAAAAPAPRAASADGLQRCIASQVTTGRRRPRWGIMVERLASRGRPRQTLFAHNARLPFNPASNVKLMTTAAALRQLGPAHRFVTRIRGRLEGSRVVGGLFLVPGGDPTLNTSALDRMARRLWQLGVRTIDGPLYVDRRFFVDKSDPPGFREFRSSHAFRTGVGAMPVNHNVVRITVVPHDQIGKPARVLLEPASPYMQEKGRIVTSGRPSRLKVSTFNKITHTGINLSGRIKAGSRPRTYWRRVFHPSRNAAATLLEMLKARGIEISRASIRQRRVPADRPTLVEHRSAELAAIIRRTNKRSSNMMAEQLFLATGADRFGLPATWAKSRRALSLYLKRFGLRPGTYRVENGSGLSRRSRMRPAQMVRVLVGIHEDFGRGTELLASLPLAGQDGTLKRRFGTSVASGLVRAKTGTLSGTLCLSGYASYKGETLAFSFLTSKIRRVPSARRRQVKMTECLIRYLKGELDTGGT